MNSKRKVRWDSQSVKALRAHLGLTQQEMADELGTRQQTISEWETGMYSPRGTSATLLSLVAERAGFAYTASVEEEPAADDVLESGTRGGALQIESWAFICYGI